jgi:RHS repeat-associated protein
LSWIGKENDVESSLGDFGARKYDPELGRFTSVDPLWEEMPGSSPFHYCFNNPIMMRDPFGLEPDGFKNQLTDVEYGDDDEEPSPIKAGKSQSQRDQEQAIRERKNEWKLQIAQRDAADKIHLTLDVAGIFDPTPCSDLTNAGLYVSEGNYLAAGISIVGVLPWIGDIFKSTRITAAMARLAERGAVKTSANVYKHSFKYADRVRMRGVQDPVSHNFPYSFDDAILASKPIPKNNGYQIFRLNGKMNGKNGVYEIGLTKDGIIDHRFFRSIK